MRDFCISLFSMAPLTELKTEFDEWVGCHCQSNLIKPLPHSPNEAD